MTLAKVADLDELMGNLNIINQSIDTLTLYGSNMLRLLERIQEEYNAKRFIKKPLGPFGSFIKVKDPSWIPAIEDHLGYNTFSSFCVDNTQDARVLNVIMKEVFINERPPQVSISKFFNQMHDVSEISAKSPKYLNLLEAIEISHPVIANALIDMKEIECILLIPTAVEAFSVMSDVSNVPLNCKRALTKKGDLIFPHPNYRSYEGSVTNRAKYLCVNK